MSPTSSSSGPEDGTFEGGAYEVVVQDPTDGTEHVFPGATLAQAEAAAEEYFNGMQAQR